MTSARSRSFCEVAIAEAGEVRSAGRIATRVESPELFAQSLVASDVVALEATTGADRIVALLQAHGIRVVVANTRKLRSISEAKAKTDRLDARTLARLLVSELLDEVWTPDERTRTLRRLTNRRGEEGERASDEGSGRCRSFVEQDLGVREAAVVVDGDVHILPAGDSGDAPVDPCLFPGWPAGR